jgi:hypothetical protein
MPSLQYLVSFTPNAPKNTFLEIYVTDRGNDLTSTQISKIFEVEMSTLKSVAKALGGRLEATSCSIETTFVLTVPCK